MIVPFPSNTSVKMLSNSSTSIPPGVKQSAFRFSAGVSFGFISSRYFGTPPVTDRTSNMSLAAVRAALFPQNRAQSPKGSSPTRRLSVGRPTKALFRRIFFDIHVETLPQTTSIRRLCFLKRLSQAYLSSPG